MPARPAAPSEAQVREYLTTLSNWGRWGSDDELGTINLVTPAKRQAAARLVTEGESVTCARPIRTDIAADTTFQPLRFMVDSGEGRDTVSPERALERRGASEFIGMVFHGYSITHVDAPSHYFWEGKLYNGRSCNAVTSREGATVCSVEGLRDGVVSLGGFVEDPWKRGEIENRLTRIDAIRDVINNLRVQGFSGNDVSLRTEVFTRIYADPMFERFANQVDPPVRVYVDRGRVTLVGMVGTRLEQQTVGFIARATLAFSVTNLVEVESEVRELKERPRG